MKVKKRKTQTDILDLTGFEAGIPVLGWCRNMVPSEHSWQSRIELMAYIMAFDD
jgi:hypothetical protein